MSKPSNLLLLLLAATSARADVSAVRGPDESFEEALARAKAQHFAAEPNWSAQLPMHALSLAGPLSRLNRRLIPPWPSMESVQAGFARIRDDRFLVLPEDPENPRRISWGCAYDGCFARAATASEHLEELGHRRPAKIFVFGRLGLRTPDSGLVSWWYHVAPIVQQQGRAYVLDPAVEPGGPLSVEDWAGRMSSDLSQVTLAVCNPFAYTPWSQCYVSGPEAEQDARRQQLYYVRQDPSQPRP